VSDHVSTRLGWLAGAAAVVGLAPLVLAAVVWSELPDPIATHWPMSDVPDGNTPKLLFFGIAGLVLVVIAAVTVMALRRAGADRRSQRLTLLYALGAAMFWTCTVGMLVLANLGASEWTDARLPFAALAVPLGVPLASVVLAARLVPVPPPVGGMRVERSARASVGLGRTERAVWISGAHSRTLLLVGPAGASVLLVAAMITGDWWLLFPAALVLVGCVATASVSVRVDRDGVRVGFGPFGWPAKVVPLEDVSGAEAIFVHPLEWGGWGYRWVPFRHASAAVVRQGEGLRLDRVDGRVFVVTVDDADRAAGLVNDLLAERFVT
jgi:hypothetical protein